MDTAHSFAAGSAVLEFDLLITDGRFNGGTGSALPDKATERGVPVLVVTADSFGIASQKYGVLAKPLRADALLAAVATTLKDCPQ